MQLFVLIIYVFATHAVVYPFEHENTLICEIWADPVANEGDCQSIAGETISKINDASMPMGCLLGSTGGYYWNSAPSGSVHNDYKLICVSTDPANAVCGMHSTRQDCQLGQDNVHQGCLFWGNNAFLGPGAYVKDKCIPRPGSVTGPKLSLFKARRSYAASKAQCTRYGMTIANVLTPEDRDELIQLLNTLNTYADSNGTRHQVATATATDDRQHFRMWIDSFGECKYFDSKGLQHDASCNMELPVACKRSSYFNYTSHGIGSDNDGHLCPYGSVNAPGNMIECGEAAREVPNRIPLNYNYFVYAGSPDQFVSGCGETHAPYFNQRTVEEGATAKIVGSYHYFCRDGFVSPTNSDVYSKSDIQGMLADMYNKSVIQGMLAELKADVDEVLPICKAGL